MPANGRSWGITVSEGDLNTQPREISPDRGKSYGQDTGQRAARAEISPVFPCVLIPVSSRALALPVDPPYRTAAYRSCACAAEDTPLGGRVWVPFVGVHPADD